MAEDNDVRPEELGHEQSAVGARGVAIAAAILIAGIFASLLLMAGLSLFLATERGGPPTVRAPDAPLALPPGIPSIDANQTATLRQLRAREQAWLTEYDWIDRDAAVARIPIRRAMEILAQQPPPELSDDDAAAR